MDLLVQSIFNGLLEESIWKIAVLEHKRSKAFRIFGAEQEQFAADKKSGNDKHHPDTVHDCPVCGREVSATRFATHLSKCLGIGGRGQAAKKAVRSEFGEGESSAKGSSQPPSDPPTITGKKQATNAKRRGRPPKKPPAVPLTPAEHEMLLSNAINNATQRLHLQGLGLPIPPVVKPVPPPPHPLSQSHVATPPAPKTKRKKKKEETTRHRSRNSSQASSSSDSEEEEEEEEEEENEDDDGEEGVDDRESCMLAGRVEGEDDEDGPGAEASEEEGASLASVAPAMPVVFEALARPALKRKSSSQADSTDGSDSD